MRSLFLPVYFQSTLCSFGLFTIVFQYIIVWLSNTSFLYLFYSWLTLGCFPLSAVRNSAVMTFSSFLQALMLAHFSGVYSQEYVRLQPWQVMLKGFLKCCTNLNSYWPGSRFSVSSPSSNKLIIAIRLKVLLIWCVCTDFSVCFEYAHYYILMSFRLFLKLLAIWTHTLLWSVC